MGHGKPADRPDRLIGTDRTPTCSYAEPWLTNVRGLATYTVPKADGDVVSRSILPSEHGDKLHPERL